MIDFIGPVVDARGKALIGEDELRDGFKVGRRVARKLRMSR